MWIIKVTKKSFLVVVLPIAIEIIVYFLFFILLLSDMFSTKARMRNLYQKWKCCRILSSSRSRADSH